MAQSAQITQKLNNNWGSCKITHPFHPLRGKNFDILKVREVNGSNHYSLRAESGVICVPESWTDRKVLKKQESDSHMLHFDAFTLKELAEFLNSLDVYQKHQ